MVQFDLIIGVCFALGNSVPVRLGLHSRHFHREERDRLGKLFEYREETIRYERTRFFPSTQEGGSLKYGNDEAHRVLCSEPHVVGREEGRGDSVSLDG